MIQFDHVSFGYPQNGGAVEDISFSLKKSGITAIIGANGAGKSTVSRLMRGLLTPSSGRILLDGQDISGMKISALAVHWHLPYQYAFTITTALHFIPVFFNDMQVISEAQLARGVSFDTRNPFKKFALMAPLSVPLLISSVKKTEQAAIAVELRGFNLRTRTSAYKVTHMKGADWAVLTAGAALIALSVILNTL